LLRGNGTISSEFLTPGETTSPSQVSTAGGSRIERKREIERSLGLNGMHKIGHRWTGTAETKGTSSSFIVY
jgi:hypothetical protein